MSLGLHVEGLVRQYGSLRVLDEVDLRVPAGRVVSILGPSGCGKSTLLRLVAGMDQPDAGQIKLSARVLSGPGVWVPPERRNINMVFQDYALWPHMRVEQIVGYGLALRKIPRARREARVRELLNLLQIEPLARRYPVQLSGGQQQRVAIARALATDPELLLLDEPLSNLDVQLRQAMREELAGLFARLGTTALYVTHDPLEASSLADEVVVLRAGRIVQQGTPESLFSAPQTPWVARLAGHDTALAAVVDSALDAGIWSCRIGQQRVRARIPQGQPNPGDRVELLLHPASARLLGPGQQPEPSENGLQGTVRRCLYETRHYRVSVALAGGEQVSVTARQRMEVGTVVTLALPVAETLAFTNVDETVPQAELAQPERLTGGSPPPSP